MSATARLRALLDRPAALPLLAGVLVAAVAIAAIGPWPVGVFYDDGIYVILAKALATGEGYRYLNIPGHPAATHYPPGYPALLALLWKLAPSFPDNVALFKVANALLLGVAAVGGTWFARARLALPALAGAGAILLALLSIPVLTVTGVLFSEPLFLALLFPSLLAAERLLEDDDAGAVRAVVAGVACGLLALVRTIGLAVAVAAFLVLLVRRRRAAGAFIAAVVVTLLPWQIWSATYGAQVPAVLEGSYGSYVGWLVDTVRIDGSGFVLAVIARNLGELLRPLMVLLSPLDARWLAWPVVILALGVFALGARRMWRLAPVTLGFLLVYMAIVIAWPYAPDRFLWGIWPLFALVLALGVRELPALVARSRPRSLRVAGWTLTAATVLALAGYIRYNVRGYRGRWWQSAQRSATLSARPLTRWVTARTLMTDVIAADDDPLVYLYTGRATIPSAGWLAADYVRPRPPEMIADDTREVLRTFGVRYLLVTTGDAATAPVADRLLHARPPELILVDTLPDGGAVFTPARRR